MTKGIENIIHNIFEFIRCVLEFEGHNIPLIMTKQSSSKSSFIRINLTNLNLLETRFHIKLKED